jgi:hypothetical protein
LYNVRGMSLVAIGAGSWRSYLFGDAGRIGGRLDGGLAIVKGLNAGEDAWITMLIGSFCCLASLAVVVAAPSAPWAIGIISTVLFGRTFYPTNNVRVDQEPGSRRRRRTCDRTDGIQPWIGLNPISTLDGLLGGSLFVRTHQHSPSRQCFR